jgi:NADH dehydrogenase
MILVAGATGQLGGLIARRLLAARKEIRILVRPGSGYYPLVEAGAVPILGDLKDPASLESPVAGVETIITTATSARRGGKDNARTVDLEGNANLLDAAVRAGVRRIIFFTGPNLRVDSPDHFSAAKAATEERLRESDLDFTIIACAPFLDVWVGRVVLEPILEGREVVYAGDGNRRHSMIVVDDVAAFAVASLDAPTASRTYLLISGPEPFSWRDAVAAFERRLKQQIPQRGVALGQDVPGVPDHLQGLITFLGTTDLTFDSTETANRFGIRRTTLNEWVDRTVESIKSRPHDGFRA